MPCPAAAATLAALAALSVPQDPAPQDGPRFVWPPVRDQPLRYRVELRKTREPDGELAAAVRAARAALDLPAARPQRQSVALQVDVALQAGAEAVEATYTTALTGRPTLRWRLLAPAADRTPGPFGNDRLEVWGEPDQRGEAAPAVHRDDLERTFAQRFVRDERGGTRPAPVQEQFGDHLLPLLWDQPLPCWIDRMAGVVGLAGEAAIEGKTLIRESSGSFPLGHRETRVELAFTKVAGDAFTFTYAMTVRQQVTKTRDLRENLAAPWWWHFAIAGEAEYSVAEQAFARIREQVTGRPLEMSEEQLARLRDEAFTGTVAVERQPDEAPRGGRRRRSP